MRGVDGKWQLSHPPAPTSLCNFTFFHIVISSINFYCRTSYTIGSVMPVTECRHREYKTGPYALNNLEEVCLLCFCENIELFYLQFVHLCYNLKYTSLICVHTFMFFFFKESTRAKR